MDCLFKTTFEGTCMCVRYETCMCTQSSFQIPYKFWSLWGEVMQACLAIVNINCYCVVELIGVATLQDPLNIAWMTDLWVQLLVLCQVPELLRTTDCTTCILMKVVYNGLELIIEENSRSVLKLVSVMCLFLCKCKSDEYMKNYVVLFNQILMIIGGNTCWSSVWIKWIFKIGFILLIKSNLMNGQRF